MYVVQEALYKLIKSDTTFESVEHEKAWLIRTAANICKNNLRHWWRKRKNLEDYENLHVGSFATLTCTVTHLRLTILSAQLWIYPTSTKRLFIYITMRGTTALKYLKSFKKRNQQPETTCMRLVKSSKQN